MRGRGSSLAPRHAIARLTEAQSAGLDIIPVLEGLTYSIQVASILKIHPSVISGLRAGVAFCVPLLGYSFDATLPPAHKSHSCVHLHLHYWRHCF